MEYLARILNLVMEKPEFRYHSLCRTLKLSHLAFADDLLLFCRGDSQSVRVMMRAFLSFSAASGLQMNRDKSDQYMNGVTGATYGSADSHKVPYVAWEQCCLPKNKGGLGIVNCPLWNVAAIGKYTWWVANKKDCLWVKWVHQIYMKHSDWWTYQPTNNTSWVWRQVCKVKDQLMQGFAAHGWTESGYSVQKVYEWLLGAQQRVTWQPFVWNRVSLPKHNFLAWLFVKKRCLTQDRLIKFGVITDGICYLCGAQQETQAHLFFDCCYSQRCVQLLQHWLGVSWQGDCVDWVIKWRCKSLCQKMIVMVAISGLVYCIWEARNKCKVDMVMKRPEAVIEHVQNVLRWRLKRSDFVQQKDNTLAWIRDKGLS
ncbi:uncharacterized protein LOC141632180 [Silene latifolia]|uniref:uncharacterized protein LOC141632180 n=1 Tax=Silene latifolia TaxID=37657 RepID=UPI003D78818A